MEFCSCVLSLELRICAKLMVSENCVETQDTHFAVVLLNVERKKFYFNCIQTIRNHQEELTYVNVKITQCHFTDVQN